MKTGNSPDLIPGLVSVILPVFNRKKMLLEAVGCVEAQTYRDLELIIVDDGSTDGTSDLCDRLGAVTPGRVTIIHRENGGPGAARESGRLVARGEYIQYFDSDDWLAPKKLERQVAFLADRPEAGVCYCVTGERLADGSGMSRPSLRTGERLDSIFPAFLTGRLWQTVTPLWRRSATDRIGAWTTLRIEEDMEYDARAGALGVLPVWCNEELAEHRHHHEERASGGEALSPEKLRHRARAHALIYGHALEAGISSENAEMQRFARELFLLSRQAGAAGLTLESGELYRLSREAAGPCRAEGWDYRAYSLVASVFGWALVGRLSCLADRLRPKRTR